MAEDAVECVDLSSDDENADTGKVFIPNFLEFEKAYERILSEFQIVLNLSLEDTQKKLDKALKRNLSVQAQPIASAPKITTTELPVEEPIADSDENLDE